MLLGEGQYEDSANQIWFPVGVNVKVAVAATCGINYQLMGVTVEI